MGYYTRYSGSLEINPPLNKDEYQRLSQVVDFWNSDKIKEAATADVFAGGLAKLTAKDKALNPEETAPGLTFFLHPDAIQECEEQVKGYENETAFALVALWLEQNKHTLTGSVAWEGESNDDSGTIFAASIDGKNRIEFVHDERSNPGPTWEKMVPHVSDGL